MNDDNFVLSQESIVLQKQPSNAYPIDIAEWDYVKSKIQGIEIKVSFFYTLSFTFLGSSIAVFVSLLSNGLKNKLEIFACTSLLILFLVTFFSSREKHDIESSKPLDVLEFMKLIEDKFESAEK